MKRFDEMLTTLCPNGIPTVELSKVCTFNRGKTITAKDAINGTVPVISGGKKPAYYHNVSNRSAGSITIAGSGAYAGYVSYWDVPIFVSDAFTVDPKDGGFDIKFIYYYLVNNQDRIFELQKGAGVPHVHGRDIANFQIPYPPLPIQQEIVSILDKFTDHIADLDSAITLRQKQFEYCREKLLTFNEGECEWKKLGEIGKMIRGNGLQKKDFTDEGYPCIHYGQVHTVYDYMTTSTKSFCSESLANKLRKAQYGDLIIATTSEDVEACCKAVVWLGNVDVAYSGDSYCFKHNQNPKYVSYLFQTEKFAKQKRQAATGTKVVRVSGESMENFLLPFPSFEHQAEIVSILDRFKELVNNLIETKTLRQKQYEYYRNKLLSFK